MAHILIVDDNADLNRVLARLLKRLGHSVDAQESGEGALGYLQSTLPDLVILDLMMPRIDGNEVLRRIREDPRTAKVPVVVYTAIADNAVRDHILSKGAQDYWVKASLDLAEMTQRLDAVLA